jgi:hypothetical protein
MSRIRPRLVAAALWLLAAPALAQLKPQAEGEHSALADVEGTPVRDDDLAAAFKAVVVKNEAANAKGASFLFQGCFGGGMIDDLEKQLKETLPWVAGAASEDDDFAWFQQTQAEAGARLVAFERQRLANAKAALVALDQQIDGLEKIPNKNDAVRTQLKWLRAARRFTKRFIDQVEKRINALKKIPQTLNVDQKPHGHWTRPLLAELKVPNQKVLDSLVNARDKDRVGVKGKPKLERGQSLAKAKGDAILLKGTAKKLHAVLWAGKTDIMAFFNDVNELRGVLTKEWKDRVEFVILFGDGTNRVLGTNNKLPWPALKATRANLLAELKKLEGKVTKDDLFLFYATNHSMTQHDQPGMQLGNALRPFRHGFSLTPAQLDGLNDTADVRPTVRIAHLGVASPNVTVRVNGIVFGNLEPFEEVSTFVVPEHLLTNCNVVELESAVEGESFPYAASVRFDTGPVAPVAIDGVVASDPEPCPEVPLVGPFGADRTVGETHTLTVQVFDVDGLPVAGSPVSFEVLDGPNEGETGSGTTDATGQVALGYVGDGGPGVDLIAAVFEDENGDEQSANQARVVWRAAPERLRCVFEVDDDGEPELEIEDVDGNGFCDFPDEKTHFHGRLRLTRETPIEFQGNTILEADEIIIEEGARLRGEAGKLRSLLMVATEDDLEDEGGEIFISATDDVTLRANAGGIDLGKEAALKAADQILIDARNGSVRFVAPDGAPANAFTAAADNKLTITAKGPRGGIEVIGTTLAARQIVLDASPNVIPSGPKGVLLDAGVVSTDPADRSGRSGSTVTIRASSGTAPEGGALLFKNGSRVAAATNMLLGTKFTGEGACFSGTATLTAKGGLGYIDTRSVRAGIVDDGTTVLVGRFQGNLAQGTCP